MNSNPFKLYLRDVTVLLMERVSEAKKAMEASPDAQEKRYQEGVAWGVLEALSLLIEEAKSFDLPLQELGMADIDVDRELASIGRSGTRHQ